MIARRSPFLTALPAPAAIVTTLPAISAPILGSTSASSVPRVSSVISSVPALACVVVIRVAGRPEDFFSSTLRSQAPSAREAAIRMIGTILYMVG